MKTVHFTLEESVCHHLFLKSPFIKDMGLFEGKMGIAISFLIYGRETENSVYSDFGDYLLDGLLAKVDKRIGLGFATGLSGIGWGIEYLIQNGFVCCNSHEVCKEIDELILLYDLRRMKDFLLSTGIEGLLHYVLDRKSVV